MESLHPMVVHFPAALFITALLLETIGLSTARALFHRMALWNLGLGVVGAAAAVLTGRMAMAAAKHSPAIYEVMERHERLGYIVFGLTAALLVGRLLVQDQLSLAQRRFALGLLTVACALMAYSAHLGGRLVYEYGVGGNYGRSTGGIQVIQREGGKGE